MTRKKSVRAQVRDLFKTLFYVLVGNAVLALSIKLFLIPADLPTDGATGLALIVNHYTGMSISLFVLSAWRTSSRGLRRTHPSE